MPPPTLSIFISHSSKDIAIVRELVELLKAALALRAVQIRCTSLDGYRLPGGAKVENTLRREVRSAAVLLGLITAQSIDSHYVMFELGARWGADEPLVPLIASRDDMALIQGPLSSLNVLDLSNPSQLHQLIYDLADILQLEPDSAAAYTDHVTSVLAAIDKTRSPKVAESAHRSDLVASIGGYSVFASGLISDQKTGLDWYVGGDINTDWPSANRWTLELTRAGGNWRMPTIDELRTLYDKKHTAGIGYYKNGKYWPAHIHAVFQAIGGGSWVWSSEAANKTTAKAFNFNQGKDEDLPRSNTTYSIRAFAVRSQT